MIRNRYSCGICGQPPSFEKKFYCAGCANQFMLEPRVDLVKTQSELFQASQLLNKALNDSDLLYSRFAEGGKTDKYGLGVTESEKTAPSVENPFLQKTPETGGLEVTKLLNGKLAQLSRQLANLQSNISATRQAIDEEKLNILKLRQENGHRQEVLKELRSTLEMDFMSKRERYKHLQVKQSDGIQAAQASASEMSLKFCRDLVGSFGIRRRRPKKKEIKETLDPLHDDEDAAVTKADSSYEIIIGFTVLPDASQITRYSHHAVNSSLERLSYFCFLTAYYLDIRLPYEIMLPQRSHPYVRMAWLARGFKQSIYLSQPPAFLAQDKPRVFDAYIKAVCMLALDLVHIANHQGISVSLDEASQMNVILPKVCISFQEPSGSDGHPISERSIFPSPIDLAALTEHVVNQTYIEINGGSAEWNLVDKEGLDTVEVMREGMVT